MERLQQRQEQQMLLKPLWCRGALRCAEQSDLNPSWL